jgi:hypothetical protein
MSLTVPVIGGLASGIVLVSIMAIFFPYVPADSSRTEKVWIAYAPIQCNKEQWHGVDTSDMPEEYRGTRLPAAYAAAEYYGTLGIIVYDYAATRGGIVPAMCGLSAGYQILLFVPEVQTAKMMAYGFRPHEGPTSEDFLSNESKLMDQ